jgi:hypothetical protein
MKEFLVEFVEIDSKTEKLNIIDNVIFQDTSILPVRGDSIRLKLKQYWVVERHFHDGFDSMTILVQDHSSVVTGNATVEGEKK